METLQGVVTNCQHTSKFPGGGKNSSASTTYIALFRIDGRPVEFRTPNPSSVSDQDQVKVAGVLRDGRSFRAYACRNLTTGEVSSSGIIGNVISLFIFPIFGFVLTLVGGFVFGRYGVLIAVGVVAAASVFFIRQIIVTSRAISLVKE